MGRARVNGAQCLDRCELGPCVVVYPEGVWYRVENETDVDEVLRAHLLEGGAGAAIDAAGAGWFRKARGSAPDPAGDKSSDPFSAARLYIVSPA